MSGKLVAAFLVLVAVVGGASIYYLQVYAYYSEVQATGDGDVQLTALESGVAEPILYDAFEAIDAESSPLRYRACFTTTLSQALLTETFALYDAPVPTVAPAWFDCFDADAIGAALEEERAIAYLGTANVIYGFDRVVAITDDGQGYVWHQLNICGEKAFDGDPLPPECPPRPEVDQ